MKSAMNIKYLSKTIGLENAARLLRESGIRLLDYTPKSREELREALAIFNRYGLKVHQTHAPFNRYSGADTAVHKKAVFDALYYTAEMGAKYIVVHGDEFDFEHREYSKNTALIYNYDYFAPVVEAAKAFNIKVAFENVFNDIPEKPRFCSYTKDLEALIDMFKTEYVCACWDTGHGAVSCKENQPGAIKLLGDKIECTHIHDNYLESDTHLVPFTGKIDWKPLTDALKSTKAEVLSLELVYGDIPAEVCEDYVKMLSRVCEKLKKM